MTKRDFVLQELWLLISVVTLSVILCIIIFGSGASCPLNLGRVGLRRDFHGATCLGGNLSCFHQAVYIFFIFRKSAGPILSNLKTIYTHVKESSMYRL